MLFFLNCIVYEQVLWTLKDKMRIRTQWVYSVISVAKDSHLLSRSVSLTTNIRFTIAHNLRFQLQVESRLFLEAGLALRSHTSPSEGFEGGLSVTGFLCPRRRCNPSLQSMRQRLPVRSSEQKASRLQTHLSDSWSLCLRSAFVRACRTWWKHTYPSSFNINSTVYPC